MIKHHGLHGKLQYNQWELKRNDRKVFVLSPGSRDAGIHAAGAN